MALRIRKEKKRRANKYRIRRPERLHDHRRSPLNYEHRILRSRSCYSRTCPPTERQSLSSHCCKANRMLQYRLRRSRSLLTRSHSSSTPHIYFCTLLTEHITCAAFAQEDISNVDHHQKLTKVILLGILIRISSRSNNTDFRTPSIRKRIRYRTIRSIRLPPPLLTLRKL